MKFGSFSFLKVPYTKQVLKHEGKTVDGESILYKKTRREFKKRYGIELEGAPIVFKKNGTLWYLVHVKPRRKTGHVGESVEYVPIVKVGKLFQRLRRDDIKTEWDHLRPAQK